MDYNATTGTFTIVLPKDNTPYILEYECDIRTGSGGKNFKNEINFGLSAGGGVSDDETVTIPGGQGGGTSSKRAAIDIIKTDSMRSGVNLEGITFGAFQKIGSNEIEVARVITDADGKARIFPLSVNTEYIIREIDGKSGYDITSLTVAKTEKLGLAAGVVEHDGGTSVPGELKIKATGVGEYEIYVTNDPTTVDSLTFIKYDNKDGDWDVLKGIEVPEHVTFNMADQTTGSTITVSGLIDEHGVAVLTRAVGIPFGVYKVEETTNIGWLKTAADFYIKITGDGTKSVVNAFGVPIEEDLEHAPVYIDGDGNICVRNKTLQSELVVSVRKCYDQDASEPPIEDFDVMVIYQVKDEEGDIIDEIIIDTKTTGANGKTPEFNITKGRDYVIRLKPKLGYYQSPDKTYTPTNDNDSVTIYAKEGNAEIETTATDIRTSTPVPDITVSIYIKDEDGELIMLDETETDKNGEIIFDVPYYPEYTVIIDEETLGIYTLLNDEEESEEDIHIKNIIPKVNIVVEDGYDGDEACVTITAGGKANFKVRSPAPSVIVNMNPPPVIIRIDPEEEVVTPSVVTRDEPKLPEDKSEEVGYTEDSMQAEESIIEHHPHEPIIESHHQEQIITVPEITDVPEETAEALVMPEETEITSLPENIAYDPESYEEFEFNMAWIPLLNGWWAEDLGDGLYMIFDENGVPLGYVQLKDGERIEDWFDFDNMLPLGYTKTNPKTGTPLALPIAAAILTAPTAIIISKRKRK